MSEKNLQMTHNYLGQKTSTWHWKAQPQFWAMAYEAQLWQVEDCTKWQEWFYLHTLQNMKWDSATQKDVLGETVCDTTNILLNYLNCYQLLHFIICS